METNLIHQIKISYLFFPLHQKIYTKTEWISIIHDNEHHTKNDSTVGIHGLNTLSMIVQLVQGLNIAIHRLLLAVP